jgi:hypothetical protein
MNHRFLVTVVALVAVACPLAAHALSVDIDRFSVTRNGMLFFDDDFGDGLVPPSGPAGAFTYNVVGAFPSAAESGGRLTLDTADGDLTTNAAGLVRQTIIATRQSNVNPANPAAGFRVGDTLAFTGVFDLLTPAGPLTSGYGIQVQDVLINAGADRAVELDVQFNELFGGSIIRFLEQDFVAHTITTLGVVPFAPPGGADQVMLTISRPDTTNNAFLGSYAFGTGGTFGSPTAFDTGGVLFTNTDFVRGRFVAFTAIPEPPSFALVLLATIGLLFVRRRSRR